MITLQVVILSSIIVTAAFLIRGLTGFGSGLLMVPMLLVLLDLTGLTESMKLVVPTAASLAVPSGIILLSTFRTRKWVRKDVLLMMIAGVAVGTPLGTYVLASVESNLLKRLFGLFLMGYALKMLFGRKDTVRETKNYLGLIAGFLGGCSGGMFGSGGPPVIIYLNRKIADKQAFRATLVLYFLVANSWQCATLFYVRLINADVLRFVLYLLPAFIIGNLVGSVLHVRINQVLFNKVVALVLLIAGLFLMIPRPMS
ncbi:sulfite exporter TauE/SafE family protein [Candidatus Poribacteria bacterium]